MVESWPHGAPLEGGHQLGRGNMGLLLLNYFCYLVSYLANVFISSYLLRQHLNINADTSILEFPDWFMLVLVDS